jgi:hypothetical protein
MHSNMSLLGIIIIIISSSWSSSIGLFWIHSHLLKPPHVDSCYTDNYRNILLHKHTASLRSSKSKKIEIS